MKRSVMIAMDQEHRINDESCFQHKCNVLLTGQAWNNNMYVGVVGEGVANKDDEHSLVGEKESMLPTLPDTEEPPTPLLLMFTHHSEADSAKQPTRREVKIGCVKSNQVKKSSGEFSIDTMAASNAFAKCFTFDVLKVMHACHTCG